MALCGDGALRVWSFAGDDASMDQDNGRTAARREEKVFARPQHSYAALVGLSLDGQTAASCDWLGGDVIVWNAATGNSIQQFEPDGPMHWRCCAVTVSNNADRTLAVGFIDNDRGAHLRLWDSTGQLLHSSAKFKIEHNFEDSYCCVSFTPDAHGCTLLIEDREEGTRETLEWTISDAGFVEVETVTPTNALQSPRMDASATAELLLKGRDTRLLTVGAAARGEEEHCTCTAVAFFDDYLNDYCAWSSPAILGGPSPSSNNHSTVMVGLVDGTVHFMEFRV
jgi:WD40 repeat protein